MSVDAIREKLRAAGNIFADIQLGMRGQNASLCLPPNAILDVTENSVAIRSRVCSVSFMLQEPFSSMMTLNPAEVAAARKTKQPISATVEKLPDGSPRYSIVTIGARTTVEFDSLRAQDRNLDKYQQWTKRVAEGLKTRLEWPE